MKYDVIVPFHIKDNNTFKWCIDGIKQLPNVNRILVVCNREYWSGLMAEGVYLFDENKVVEGLHSKSFNNPRWGWYFQQILKIGMADWVETQYFLVVDADTVFLRPVEFFFNLGKPLYATGTEYHKPYFDTIGKILGFHPNREYSFITHHMMFNKALVIKMRESFEKSRFWHDSVSSLVSSNDSLSLFSEYETYGHFIKEFFPDELTIRPLKWTNFAIEPTDKDIKRLSKIYDYCSFHLYSRESKSSIRKFTRRLKFELKLLNERKNSK